MDAQCQAGVTPTEPGWFGLLHRLSGIVGRSGQAMAGAMCGTFVAAQLTMTSPATFDFPEFIAAMVLSGIVAFYLGIDMPLTSSAGAVRRVGRAVQLLRPLGAMGTFLATLAALISIYDFVVAEPPGLVWEAIIAGGWMLGVTIQAAVGLVTRFVAVGQQASESGR